jgi:mRNA-degrading endonuclease RelE of RelBE toxin-antitoxin system
MYRVDVSKRLLKIIGKYPKKDREAIIDKLDELKKDPRPR